MALKCKWIYGELIREPRVTHHVKHLRSSHGISYMVYSILYIIIAVFIHTLWIHFCSLDSNFADHRKLAKCSLEFILLTWHNLTWWLRVLSQCACTIRECVCATLRSERQRCHWHWALPTSLLLSTVSAERPDSTACKCDTSVASALPSSSFAFVFDFVVSSSSARLHVELTELSPLGNRSWRTLRFYWMPTSRGLAQRELLCAMRSECSDGNGDCSCDAGTNSWWRWRWPQRRQQQRQSMQARVRESTHDSSATATAATAAAAAASAAAASQSIAPAVWGVGPRALGARRWRRRRRTVECIGIVNFARGAAVTDVAAVSVAACIKVTRNERAQPTTTTTLTLICIAECR